MPIETIRNVEELGDGTKLVARYKGKEYRAEVVKLEDGKFAIRSGRKEYTSPSSAGKAITGGAVNGWVFWSREEEAKAKAATKAAKPKPVKPTKASRAKAPAPDPEEAAHAGDAASEPFEDAS